MNYNFKKKEKIIQLLEDKIQLLKDKKVFEIKNGKVVLHFDHNGNLRKIETQKVEYRL